MIKKYFIGLLAIFTFLETFTSCLNNKKDYLYYYDQIKDIPVKKLAGWSVYKRPDENVYRFKYQFKPLSHNDSLCINQEGFCELSFRYYNQHIKFDTLGNPLADKKGNYMLLAKVLGSSGQNIKETIFGIINLYFQTGAITIKSEPVPANFVLFTFGKNENIVLTYVWDSASDKIKNDITMNDKKINNNWYYYERKQIETE